MSEEEHRKLQLAGANARALGRTEIDNPFYKAENCPAATGESREEWLTKLEAWDLGFKVEAAMRP